MTVRKSFIYLVIVIRVFISFVTLVLHKKNIRKIYYKKYRI